MGFNKSLTIDQVNIVDSNIEVELFLFNLLLYFSHVPIKLKYQVK